MRGHAALTLALVVYVLAGYSLDIDPAWFTYPTCVVLLALFCWSLWSWKVAVGSLFDPYGIFLIAASLFNAGQAYLEVFQLNQYGVLSRAFSPSITLRALWLVLLGMAFLHLGALFAVARSRVRTADETRIARATPALRDSLRWTGWLLLAVSIVPAAFILKDAINTALTQGYQALYQNPSYGIGAGADILAAFLVSAALFLLAGSAGSRPLIGLSAVVIVLYATARLLLGFRSPAVIDLIFYGWLWDRTVHRLPRTALAAVAGTLLVIVFPLVRITRLTVGQNRFSLDFLVQAYSTINNPALASISEMGKSISTVAYTLSYVPSLRDFDFGLQYLYDALSMIPNLFWDVHPTVAHGTYAGWLIQLVDPVQARAGGGLGFSFIAEAYLNFGWIGAPIVLALAGYGLARYVLWATHSNNPAKFAAVAAFFVFATLWVRNESTDVFRPLLWYSLIPYFLVVLKSRGRVVSPRRERAGSIHAPFEADHG